MVLGVFLVAYVGLCFWLYLIYREERRTRSRDVANQTLAFLLLFTVGVPAYIGLAFLISFS